MAKPLGAEIKLKADRQQLKRDLAAARKEWRGFTKSVGRSLSSLGRNAGIAAGALTAGFAAAAKSSISAASELYNLSRNAGVTAEEFQKLNSAFQDFGGSEDTLTVLLNDTQDRIGDAMSGAQSYRDDLAEIGLSYEDLAAKSPVDALQDIVTALHETENTARRAFVGNSLLGGEYEKIKGVIEDGGWQAIRKYGDEVAAAGILTDHTVKELKAFEISLAEVGRVSQAGFANALAESFGGLRLSTEQLNALHEAVHGAATGMIDALKGIYKYRDAIWTSVKALIAFKAVLIGVGAGKAIVAGIKALNAGLLLLRKNFLRYAKAAGLAFLATLKFVAIPAILGGIVIAATQIAQAIKGNMDVIGKVVVSGIDFMKAQFKLFGERVRHDFTVLGNAIAGVFDSIGKSLVDAINWAIGKINEFLPTINRLIIAANDFLGTDIGTFGDLDTIQYESGAAERAAENAESRERVVRAATERNAALAKFIGDLKSGGATLWKAIKGEFGDLTQFTAEQWDKYAGPIIERIKALAKGDLPDLDLTGTIPGTDPLERTKTTIGAGETQETRDARTEYMKDIQQFATTIANGFKQSLKSAFMTGDWKGVAKALLNSFQSALADQFINKLTRWLGDMLSDLSANLTKRGGGGFFADLIGGLGGAFKGPAAHTGLRVPGGKGNEKPYLLQGGEFVLTSDQFNSLIGADRYSGIRDAIMEGDGAAQEVNIEQNILGDPTRQMRRTMREYAEESVHAMQALQRETGLVLS